MPESLWTRWSISLTAGSAGWHHLPFALLDEAVDRTDMVWEGKQRFFRRKHCARGAQYGLSIRDGVRQTRADIVGFRLLVHMLRERVAETRMGFQSKPIHWVFSVW